LNLLSQDINELILFEVDNLNINNWLRKFRSNKSFTQTTPSLTVIFKALAQRSSILISSPKDSANQQYCYQDNIQEQLVSGFILDENFKLFTDPRNESTKDKYIKDSNDRRNEKNNSRSKDFVKLLEKLKD
jgi:hypothetical protein